MSETSEIKVQWFPVGDEGLATDRLGRALPVDELSNGQVENDGPGKTRYAQEHLQWAMLRLAQAPCGSFDAEFLSGVIVATPDCDVQRREFLSRIRAGEGDDIVVSNWFVSGYVSTKMLFNQCDFSRLRFTAELGDEVVAVMKEKYRVSP